MARTLGSEISHALKARGVTTIFGIPGVHNVELYRGIEEAGITHILARHEQGAGFMADGYARASGRPGVAYVITGPGLCNIMTPMGQAQSDSVPLLVISSCLRSEDLGQGKGRLHEMFDQQGAAETVCGWSATAPDAATAYRWIDRALAEFACARPGARHLQVPIDALEASADPAPAPRVMLPGGQPAPEAIAQTAALCAAASKPLLLVGGGAKGASEPLRKIAGQLGAASLSTFAGRGIFAADTPLHLGAMISRPGSKTLIEEADLVLVIGSELSETDFWRDDPGFAGKMIRVDIDPAMLAGQHRADLAIAADAAAFAEALAAVLPGQKDTGWDAARLQQLHASFRAEAEAVRPDVVPAVKALHAALPPETLIYSDMTQFAYTAKEILPADRPGLWHHPYGFGTLGYALPAAIGGKIARPDLPVVAIAGDYGFHYTMQELGVAVELGLSLPIVIWDNSRLGAIEDAMIASQIAPNAVEAHNPDFVTLARAFGAEAVTPPDLDAFAAALRDALTHPGPTLIHLTPACRAPHLCA